MPATRAERRQQRAQTEVLRRTTRAVRRAEKKRLEDAVREVADEKIAPAIQRLGVLGTKQPRLVRDGISFRVASPIVTLHKMGKKRTANGDEPTVNTGHVRAADRLQKDWELARTISIGTSTYGQTIGGGGESGVMSQTVLRSVQRQHAAANQIEAARASLGPLWPVVEAVALQGMDVGTWAKTTKRDKMAAFGYLTAALDQLVEHYRRLDGPRHKEKRNGHELHVAMPVRRSLVAAP